MAPKEILQVLEILALSCDPPFPLDEVKAKVESALKRSEKRDLNLTEEVRQWVLGTDGDFSVTDYLNSGQPGATGTKRDTIKKILQRLRQEGLIEKSGNRDGVYRRIERECSPIDFLTVTGEDIDLRWPFPIERYVRILPKNIIVIAGEPNSGKTAFLLNLVQMNQAYHKIYYFSSEMGALELKERLLKFGCPLESWKFSPFERSSQFADVIRPDDVNLIDFLEMNDEFYKIGGLIKEVYDKLQKGIAVIAIQKNPGRDYGLGGVRSLEKARLYLAIEPNKIKIVKAKNWAGSTNPNGLEVEFKLAQGCRFSMTSEWEKRG